MKSENKCWAKSLRAPQKWVGESSVACFDTTLYIKQSTCFKKWSLGGIPKRLGVCKHLQMLKTQQCFKSRAIKLITKKLRCPSEIKSKTWHSGTASCDFGPISVQFPCCSCMVLECAPFLTTKPKLGKQQVMTDIQHNWYTVYLNGSHLSVPGVTLGARTRSNCVILSKAWSMDLVRAPVANPEVRYWHRHQVSAEGGEITNCRVFQKKSTQNTLPKGTFLDFAIFGFSRLIDAAVHQTVVLLWPQVASFVAGEGLLSHWGHSSQLGQFDKRYEQVNRWFLMFASCLAARLKADACAVTNTATLSMGRNKVSSLTWKENRIASRWRGTRALFCKGNGHHFAGQSMSCIATLRWNQSVWIGGTRICQNEFSVFFVDFELEPTTIQRFTRTGCSRL